MYDHSKDKFIVPLRDEIMCQADYYLRTQKGEFYPFGCAVTKDGELQSISAYTGEEFPTSQPLIDLLEDGFKKGIAGGKYIICAIGIDIFINTPEANGKQSAMQIRIVDEDGVILQYLITYSLDEEYNVKWLESSLEEV